MFCERRELHIEFPLLSKAELEKLFAFEKSLVAKGISFDTGYHITSRTRDWELDWSLKGATREQVIELLKKECPELHAKIKFP